MGLMQVNWNPTARQLRQFGVICLLLLPVLAWFWSGNSIIMMASAGIGVLILIVSGLYPKGVLLLYVALTIVTAPIGFVVGEVALFLIFIAVFLPMGVLFRVMSRDRLRLKIDRQATSYWQPKRPPRSIASYYRQS